jgi:hypothetical protein
VRLPSPLLARELDLVPPEELLARLLRELELREPELRELELRELELRELELELLELELLLREVFFLSATCLPPQLVVTRDTHINPRSAPWGWRPRR